MISPTTPTPVRRTLSRGPLSRNESCPRFGGRLLRLLECLVLLTVVPPTFAADAPPDERKRKDEPQEEVVKLSAFEVSAPAGFGATPGGAKDARYLRDTLKRGGIPHPNAITAEGLFSEHDLPIEGSPCPTVLCLAADGMPATLLTQPGVRYLAQIGFSSGLDPATWRRAPLNLVAVVDKSGSMNGHPLELVRESLKQVLSQMTDGDQISIVLYGDQSHIYLQPAPVNAGTRPGIQQAIDAIESAGSTNMEAGLTVGYDLAARTAPAFHGRTRLMQFTDEQPNVGATDSRSFMGLMAEGSRRGIGITVVGVGVQFGAELASKVAAVRGANLFFFPDEKEMRRVFREELDTMVTELAYNLDLVITPRPGLRIAAIYGVPGELLRWVDARSLRLRIETIFLSTRKGAIFVALAPENENLPLPSDSGGLGSVALSYEPAYEAGPAVRSRLALPVVASERAGTGLRRGVVLVNEYLGLKAAAQAYLVDNDREAAFRVLRDLVGLLRRQTDPTLAAERTMAENLFASVAFMSGHQGEPVAVLSNENPAHPLWGAWKLVVDEGEPVTDPSVMCILPGGTVYIIINAAEGSVPLDAVEEHSYTATAGTITILKGDVETTCRWTVTGDQLTMQPVKGDATESRFRRTKIPAFTAEHEPLDPATGLPARK